MSKLKERLFGLIVVIALGVIFVPMLLENTQNPKSNVTQETPSASVAKNENDKNQKPDILAKLKESSSEKPVVYDDKQPISDRPEIKTQDENAQKQAESLKAEQEKAALQQREQAKIEQLKLEEDKRHQAEALKAKQEQEKLEQAQRRQAEIEQAKQEQAKLEEEKRQQAQKEQMTKLAQDKKRQEEITQAKLEQQKLEEAKAQQAKEQAKLEQAKLEQRKLEEAKVQQAQEQAKHEQEKLAQPVKRAEAPKVEKHKEVVKSKPAKIPAHVAKGGWVVQMGSFAEHSNASNLLKKLKAAGYPAFTRHVNRYGMDLTVVMVGPHARRDDADRLCATLGMKFQIDGIVVRYEPH